MSGKLKKKPKSIYNILLAIWFIGGAIVLYVLNPLRMLIGLDAVLVFVVIVIYCTGLAMITSEDRIEISGPTRKQLQTLSAMPLLISFILTVAFKWNIALPITGADILGAIITGFVVFIAGIYAFSEKEARL